MERLAIEKEHGELAEEIGRLEGILQDPKKVDEICTTELTEIKEKFGYTEPTRSFMDDDNIKWRFGGPPDYSLANLLYLKGRSKVHAEGSLEQIVVCIFHS